MNDRLPPAPATAFQLTDWWPAESDWTPHLRDVMASDAWRGLNRFLQFETGHASVFPAPENIFRAFRETPWSSTRVVILGQDPYHGPGQAHGLSFSVPEGVRPPPSLKNILRELSSDTGTPFPDQAGNLTPWAKQGVLLLNTVLTVTSGQPHSHRGRGWEPFTDAVVEALANHPRPLVFVLWGKPAAQWAPRIPGRHQVLTAPHPSPLSAYRGFFGSQPFSRINQWLVERGETPIDWRLETT